MESGKNLTKTEVEEKIKILSDEEINLVINMNNILGNLGPEYFQTVIDMVCKALFILQKDHIPGNIVNINIIVNKLLQPPLSINRIEVICVLYYLQQTIGTILMDMDSNGMPTWYIREDIFKKNLLIV